MNDLEMQFALFLAGLGFFFTGLDGIRNNAEAGRTYRYRVVVMEDGAPATLFETELTVPLLRFVLEQNRPNPFRTGTTIRFAAHEAGQASLTVRDVTGRPVRVLVHRWMEPGNPMESWDGRATSGARLGTGRYYHRLRSGQHEQAHSMLLLD